MNSPASSVTSLMPYQSAIVTCFVFWRENRRAAIWDFCNTIRVEADSCRLSTCRCDNRLNFRRCFVSILRPRPVVRQRGHHQYADNAGHDLACCRHRRLSVSGRQALNPPVFASDGYRGEKSFGSCREPRSSGDTLLVRDFPLSFRSGRGFVRRALPALNRGPSHRLVQTRALAASPRSCFRLSH
jgi:hypothetical protein